MIPLRNSLIPCSFLLRMEPDTRGSADMSDMGYDLAPAPVVDINYEKQARNDEMNSDSQTISDSDSSNTGASDDFVTAEEHTAVADVSYAPSDFSQSDSDKPGPVSGPVESDTDGPSPTPSPPPEKKAKMKAMRTQPIPLLALKFIVPSAIAMAVQSLYSVADITIVGRSDDGANAMAGIALYYPLEILAMALCTAIGIGCNTVVSNALGAKDYMKARRGLGNSLLLGSIIAIVFPALFFFLLTPIFNATGATDATRTHALNYGYVLLPSIAGQLLNVVASEMYRATGHPFLSMVSMVVSALINVSLDLILIIGFGMGTRGCAIATSVANFVPGIFFVVFITVYRKTPLRIRPKIFRPDFRLMMAILGVGLGMFINQVGGAVISVSFNFWVARLLSGDDVVAYLAGTQAMLRTMMLVFVPVISIALGIMPIIGFSYGAKLYGRLAQTYIFGLVTATAFCIVGWGLFMAIPELLMRVYTSDPATLDAGVKIARLQYPLFFLVAFNVVTGMAYMGTRKPIFGIITMTMRQVGAALPAMWILGAVFRDIEVLLTFNIFGTGVTTVFNCLLIPVWIFMILRERQVHRASLREASIEEGPVPYPVQGEEEVEE